MESERGIRRGREGRNRERGNVREGEVESEEEEEKIHHQ